MSSHYHIIATNEPPVVDNLLKEFESVFVGYTSRKMNEVWRNVWPTHEVALMHFFHEKTKIFIKAPWGRHPLTEAVGRGLGVGVAVPPPRTQRKTPAKAGVSLRTLFVVRHAVPNILTNIAELVGQFLSARLDLVFDFGETGINARLGGVNPFLKPLKRATDGHGDVVAVLVDDTLNQFEVFLF